MKKKLIFRGVATALITPMRSGKINYEALSDIIEMQISSGVPALVVGGTTGEAATLSDSERYQLYTYTKAKVKGRVKLIFGAGTNDTEVAIKHAESAELIGGDGILVVTPYYNKGTFRGVCEHYKRIASSTSLPLILYNVPSRTGVNLTIGQIEELLECENIVGIKEAGDSADRLSHLSLFSDRLAFYAGNDSQTYSVCALGGDGVISVASNLYPERMNAICNAVFSGNYEEGLKIQKDMLGFIHSIFLETNPAPIKYAMSCHGLSSEEVRLPLYIPEKSTRDAVSYEMQRLMEKGIIPG